MAGLLTNKAGTRELLQQYYSPSLLLKNTYDEYENLYCFIAKVEPWTDEDNPPTPSVSDSSIRTILSNIIIMKKVQSNDISPVIERIDWQTGTTYSQYDSESNMFERDANGKLVKKFYVRNSYDQIFKCLWNGTSEANPTGIPSTAEPLIDFSNIDVSNIIETIDGYKWKYLYSVQYNDKIKYFDDDWIPVPVSNNRKNLHLNPVGSGEISLISVYNSGNNYIDDTGTGISTTIYITGDGNGAEAAAVISGGIVTNVVMVNRGNNYTYANVSISANPSYTGNGAILKSSLSPIGGHGYDLISELGSNHIMISSELDRSENGVAPTDFDYRQVGLLSNPMVLSGTEGLYANSFIYNLSFEVVVSPSSDNYVQDEIVYQGASLEESSFHGTVLRFDPDTNVLYLINTAGSIAQNQILRGKTSNVVRLVNSFTSQDFIKYSGELIYVENKKRIQRSSSGIEQFRLVIKY